MTNYKLRIQYDGGRYDGWQRQGNTANTIQTKLEQVLGKMAEHRIEIHAAGRTDAGVHARAQVANFHLQTVLTPTEIRDYCNRYLPNDIAVLSCEAVPERFHARLNAQAKRYIYRIWTGPVPNVFERRYLTEWQEPLNVEAMRHAAIYLTGKHDFRAFSSNKRYKKSTVREIYKIEITQHGDEIRILYFGNGFLYNMVRILTGTLVEVGSGQRMPESMTEVLESCDRQRAGITMPPQGLILDEVFYD